MGVDAAGDGAPCLCLRWSSPSLPLISGSRGGTRRSIVCGVGVIALLAQGDPPHPTTVERHGAPGSGRQIVSQDSRRRQPIHESGQDPEPLDGTAGPPGHRWTLTIKRHLHTPCRLGARSDRGAPAHGERRASRNVAPTSQLAVEHHAASCADRQAPAFATLASLSTAVAMQIRPSRALRTGATHRPRPATPDRQPGIAQPRMATERPATDTSRPALTPAGHERLNLVRWGKRAAARAAGDTRKEGRSCLSSLVRAPFGAHALQEEYMKNIALPRS